MKSAQKTALFLYTELAGYVLACMHELAGKGWEVHVVRWPINNEAPFEFRPGSSVKLYKRESMNTKGLLALANQINPDIVLCSGWVDKGYLTVCKKFVRMLPVVLLLDNQWRGSMKQKIMTFAAGFTIRPFFNRAWVPGDPQYVYAQKLGFLEPHLKTGFYCADTSLFSQWRESFSTEKNRNYPKTLLYVGRYVEHKGIRDLWECFIALHENQFPEWRLICAGSGELWEHRTQHTAIEHLGFVQPTEFGEIIRRSGIFVLPSRYEPWGVVVQEMGACGLPMLLSQEVGAASMFLREGINGYSFPAGNRKELSACLTRLMSTSECVLQEMGAKSAEIALTHTPQQWVDTLEELSYF
jgi:glycosyltransferase involved in cell wall biosynthesis